MAGIPYQRILTSSPYIPPQMKMQSSPRTAAAPGLTLLELTVVILVLLSLVGIMFIGARGWKNGTDRAGCILKIRAVQVATRSYQNLYGYSPGSLPYASNGTQDIASHLHQKGYIDDAIFENSQGRATCPSGGNYSIPAPDVFPEIGTLYMTCSLSTASNHVPASHADW